MKHIIAYLVVLLVFVSGCRFDKKIFLNYPKNKSGLPYCGGLYFLEPPADKQAPEYMFFYADGTIIIGNWVILDVQEFREDPSQYLKSNLSNLHWNGCTGRYVEERDTLLIEVYQRTYQSFYKYVLEKYKATINTDSTVTFFENECKWCDNFYGNYKKSKDGKYTLNTKYKFHPSDYKPDSSQIWFKNEKWYKKEIDNRK